jgi:hypothetical protein
MNGIIEFINELNPWKVCFFAFFIIFLSSLFISIRRKYREYKKDYQKIRSLVYQLFTESEKKEIKKVVESAVHDAFTEARKELFPKSDKTTI